MNVPEIRMTDAVEGVLGIEWIEGKSVRALLPGGTDEEDETVTAPNDETNNDYPHTEDNVHNPLTEYGVSLGAHFCCVQVCSRVDNNNFKIDTLMTLIGTEIAKMHLADIIHGDLTTSNMMLRHPSSFSTPTPSIPTELVRIVVFC